MKYALLSQLDALDATDSLLVGLCGKTLLGAEALPEGVSEVVDKALKRGDASAKRGATLVLPHAEGKKAGPGRLIVVGCGDKAAKLDADGVDRAIEAGTRAALKLGNKRLVISLHAGLCEGEPATAVRRAIASAGQATYRFEECRSKKPEARALKTIALLTPAGLAAAPARAALRQGEALAEGLALACDLGNRPGNLCTPTDLARVAQDMAGEFKNLKSRVLGEAEMAELGMGALLSVSRGSREEAQLIVLEWSGGKKGDKPIALVGKGLTFDAGGISLKPADKMDEMKYDMCGGGTVFGVVKAAAELDLKVNLVGIVPASENMPDGQANKPGDIVTSMAGITIEVLNTDAEGRLILCDALTWAQQEYDAEAIIDIATLTGACVIALGQHASGLFANQSGLARSLLNAGEAIGDRAWELPLWEDYQSQLRSPFADVANVGGREAGSITAASFLHRFTRKAKWAHLDIAGSAWTSNPKGGTGRPVPLLTNFLIQKVEKRDS